MNRVCVSALVAITLASSKPAGAQVFGQFTGAEALPVNGRMFGAYVHSSADLAGLLAQLRLSFYPGVDFGFQGGIARRNLVGGDRTTLRLGTDLKVGVASAVGGSPIALALGGQLGVETGDHFHVLTLGPTLVASRTLPVGQSGRVTPYAGLGLAFASIDDQVHAPPTNDTRFTVPLRLGADFLVAPELRLALELQFQRRDSLNDTFGLVAGVNLPF